MFEVEPQDELVMSFIATAIEDSEDPLIELATKGRILSVYKPLGVLDTKYNPNLGLLSNLSEDWFSELVNKVIVLCLGAEYSNDNVLRVNIGSRFYQISMPIRDQEDVWRLFSENMIFRNPIALVMKSGWGYEYFELDTGWIESLLIQAFDNDGFLLVNI